MIVDFTISNFRSIKTKQTFSMYAENTGSHLLGNIAYPADNKIGVLKCAGIYGANASGKSNLLLAFNALKYIICSTGDLKEGDAIPCYEPYLLSENSKSEPVRFEVEFFTPDKKRYRYVVSFTKEKIVEEYLDFFPSVKQASIFSRKPNDTWDTISFGTFYKGGRKRHPLFENNAYISVSGNKADAPELIRNVYSYFRKEMLCLGCDQRVLFPALDNENNMLRKVAGFLSLVDTGITDIKLEQNKRAAELIFPKNIPDGLKDSILRREKIKYIFSHKTDVGGVEYFDLDKESSGTQKLFGLAPALIDALESGGVLVLDELDNSMHPFMAELIIKLFNDDEVNCNGAQLIFSTHNVNLMSPESFRRDQIWFTEKNDGATIFYSLEDFDKKKVKSQSPFNRWYAEGRFGGVPRIDYEGIVGLLKASRGDDAKDKEK